MVQHIDGWLEYATIGAMYAIALTLLLLSYLGIDDLAALGATLDEYAAYILPLLLAGSYSIGKATAELLSVLGERLPENVKRRIRGPRPRTPTVDAGLAAVDAAVARNVRRLQYGSAALVRRVGSTRRTIDLFRSLLVATPVLITCFAIWARKSAVAVLVAPVAIVGAAMTVVLFTAYRIGHQKYYAYIAVADEEIAKLQSVPSSQPPEASS